MESNLKKSINSGKSNNETMKPKNSQTETQIINNEDKKNIKNDEIIITTNISEKNKKTNIAKSKPLNKNKITLSEQSWEYNHVQLWEIDIEGDMPEYEIPFNLLLSTKNTPYTFKTDKNGLNQVKEGKAEIIADSEPFKIRICKNKNDKNWKLIFYEDNEKCNIIDELANESNNLSEKDKRPANKNKQQLLNELLKNINFKEITSDKLDCIIEKVINNLVEPILKDYADKMIERKTKLQNSENAYSIKNKIITKFKKLDEESRKKKAFKQTCRDLSKINYNISDIPIQQRFRCSAIDNNFTYIDKSIANIKEISASINSIEKKIKEIHASINSIEKKLIQNNKNEEDKKKLNSLKKTLVTNEKKLTEEKQRLVKNIDELKKEKQRLIENIDELKKLSKKCQDIIKDNGTEKAIKDIDNHLLTIYGNMKKTLIPKLDELQEELEDNISQYESKKEELEGNINQHRRKKKRIITEIFCEKKNSSKESNMSKEKKSHNNTYVDNNNDKNNSLQLNHNNKNETSFNIAKSNISNDINIDNDSHKIENIDNDKNNFDVTINNNNVKKIDNIEDSNDNSLKDNGPDTNAIRRMKYLNLNLNINNQNTLTKINTNTKEHTININRKIDKKIETENGTIKLTIIQKDNNDPDNIVNNGPEKKGNDGLENKDNNGNTYIIKAALGGINGAKISNNIIDDKDNNLNSIIIKKGENININNNNIIKNSLLNKENPNIFLNNININNNEQQLGTINNDDKKINTINTNIIQNNNTNSGVFIGREKDINTNTDNTIFNKEIKDKSKDIVGGINNNNNNINTGSIVTDNNDNTKKKSNNNILNARDDNNRNKNNNPRQTQQLKWYQCRCCFPDVKEIDPNQVSLMNNNQANMYIFGEEENKGK